MTVRLPDHLDLIATAPAGIQKLRGLILELAVRGRLVPQDPNDEPASELLKRIAKERARQETAGLSKPSKATPLSEDTERSFKVPETWQWVRFEEIAQHNSGKTLDKGRNSGEPRPYITTSNLYWGRFELDSARQMLINDDELQRCTARMNDLLICEGGEAGRAAVWPNDYEICFQNHVHRARLFGGINPYFAYRFFEKLNASGEIDLYRKGVGISNMSGKALASILFPVPPLAEQHRIVAKVNELMALCDRLEAEQTDAGAAHARLVATLLGTLTQSADAAELAANWQRLAEHFDTLFTTEASLDALKQTILQLAVMGKLVPQDPHERPVLGKLGDFAEFLNGYAFKSQWFTDAGVRLLRNTNVAHGECDWKDSAYISADRLDEFKTFALVPGDLVLSLDRPIISTGLKLARISRQDLPCLLLQRVAKVSPRPDEVAPDYLFHWFNGPVFTKAIDPGRSKGVPHISTKHAADVPFVRYSIDEQHRIVAKVDELLALVDRLKAGLAESRARQEHLAATLIESALQAA